MLETAVIFQNPHLVELLLGRGADTNVPDTVGGTPLLWAARLRTTNVAHLLLAHGANPNVQDKYGETALFDTLFSPDAKDLIPDLLAHGASPNLPNRQGQTPFQVAQKEGYIDIVRLFKQHGAKVR